MDFQSVNTLLKIFDDSSEGLCSSTNPHQLYYKDDAEEKSIKFFEQQRKTYEIILKANGSTKTVR